MRVLVTVMCLYLVLVARYCWWRLVDLFDCWCGVCVGVWFGLCCCLMVGFVLYCVVLLVWVCCVCSSRLDWIAAVGIARRAGLYVVVMFFWSS